MQAYVREIFISHNSHVLQMFMFCKCKRVDSLCYSWQEMQQFIYLMYLTYEKIKNKYIYIYIYCNKRKYFLCYNRICVLSISKEDSAKKKRSAIPNVFGILSNFKIFSTGFQTTVLYVTTWKLLWPLRQNLPLKFVLAQN